MTMVDSISGYMDESATRIMNTVIPRIKEDIHGAVFHLAWSADMVPMNQARLMLPFWQDCAT